ncbi:MAG: winged helix-turn-helix domain-containing protein, partial [Thermoanaerobaculia bacterium]
RRLAATRAKRETEPGDRIRAGHLELDLQRYEATWKGERVGLTVTEFMMLRALVRHPGHVKTREQLMREGYPYDTFVSDRTVDSHVKRLRRKFETVDSSFDAIETVYGLGYRYGTGEAK